MRSIIFLFKIPFVFLLCFLFYFQFCLIYISFINIPVKNEKSVISYKNSKNPEDYDARVSSYYNYFPSRQSIRNTYGKNNVKFKYIFEKGKERDISHCFLFSIGYREDLVLNQMVDFESFFHKDIIRIPIYDEYRKTANKIVITLHLLDQMTIPFKFVIKSDDDIFLKINKIIPLLHHFKKENVFIGSIINKGIPIRNVNHKWYVSKEDYPYDFYKPYMQGFCYIFRRSILNTITKRHYTVPLIPMEDIHISYLVTESGYNLSDAKFLRYCTNFHGCKDSHSIDIGRNLLRRKYILNLHKKEYSWLCMQLFFKLV
ncbi:hypothetical protein MXB_4707 [Myxobolus squamalis]|nr:hypothetical protein MXB_4707 [Myxobolus squamalis]